MLAKIEGIAGGISSGAVLSAAIELNEDLKMKNKNTIIILPSFAESISQPHCFRICQMRNSEEYFLEKYSRQIIMEK